MSKVSIIIPSRNEKWLNRTVKDVYEKATGEFEVIVGLNGKTEFGELPLYENLRVHQEPENIGLKPMINKLAELATGEYLFKIDSHVMLGEGFDEILKADMQDDWVVTPRFYVLDAEKWDWQDDRFYDYFYLCCPFTDKRGLRFKAGGHWPEKTKEELPYYEGSIEETPFKEPFLYRGSEIDETPQIHGSAWFVNRDYYFDKLKFPEQDPDGHAQEPIWLALKNWLIGGKVMVNKNTWYAHLHQDSKDRGYPEDRKHTEDTYRWTADYWLTNTEPNLKHDFKWFVNKFMPMPTWPEDWEARYNEYLRLYS